VNEEAADEIDAPLRIQLQLGFAEQCPLKVIGVFGVQQFSFSFIKT
jgi:hypothetical protein